MNKTMRVAYILVGILAITLIWVAFASISKSDYPSIEYIYEDGAGTLSNGQTFCIRGELCDD